MKKFKQNVIDDMLNVYKNEFKDPVKANTAMILDFIVALEFEIKNLTEKLELLDAKLDVLTYKKIKKKYVDVKIKEGEK